MSDYYGLFGTIILIIDIWAIVNLLVSHVSIGTKILWVILIVLLPVIGAVLWLVIGPRAK